MVLKSIRPLQVTNLKSPSKLSRTRTKNKNILWGGKLLVWCIFPGVTINLELHQFQIIFNEIRFFPPSISQQYRCLPNFKSPIKISRTRTFNKNIFRGGYTCQVIFSWRHDQLGTSKETHEIRFFPQSIFSSILRTSHSVFEFQDAASKCIQREMSINPLQIIGKQQ